MVRHRALNNDAGDPGIHVEPMNDAQQFLGMDIFGEDSFLESYPDFFGGSFLISDIELGCGCFSDRNRNQVRAETRLGDILDLSGDLRQKLGGDLAAVTNLVPGFDIDIF